MSEEWLLAKAPDEVLNNGLWGHKADWILAAPESISMPEGADIVDCSEEGRRGHWLRLVFKWRRKVPLPDELKPPARVSDETVQLTLEDILRAKHYIEDKYEYGTWHCWFRDARL